jgi:hypothetical protein
MSTACIEQKHGGVPQRPALQTLRSGSEVQSPDVARQGSQLHARSRVQNLLGVLCIERLTSYMRIIQYRSGESSSDAKCLTYSGWSRSMVAYRRGRPAVTRQSGSEMQSPDVLQLWRSPTARQITSLNEPFARRRATDELVFTLPRFMSVIRLRLVGYWLMSIPP